MLRKRQKQVGGTLPPLGVKMDQCEKCKNIYANYLEFVRVCFKCHKTLCLNCCSEIICPECKERMV